MRVAHVPLELGLGDQRCDRVHHQDAQATQNLDRKIFDVNEAPHVYEGRIEHVNDIITALLREERLRVTHGSVVQHKKEFLLEPYTLLVYKKGLYLVGRSLHHQSIRTFALDGFREVEWMKGERFEYPADYHPSDLVEGAFGLIGGPKTRVCVFFDEKVARFVRRRQWHPSQRVEKSDGGIVLSLEIAGTVEFESWVLGFGALAEVLEPDSLREKIGVELARAAKRYA